MLLAHPNMLAPLAARTLLKAGFCALIVTSYVQMVEDHPWAEQRVPPAQWVDSVLLRSPGFAYPAAAWSVPAALGVVLQMFPPLSTWVRGWGGAAKAAVDLVEPLNRIFVGKTVHTTLHQKLHYDFFWLTVLTLKLCFSYTFQIRPLVEPTLDIWRADLSGWYASR
jgi:callose synthase